MCYFDQIRFTCGSWKWDRFREQCTKEYRTGETYGLKLVFSTWDENKACRACTQMATKQRRVTKMMADLERWRREGNRPATVERTEVEVAGLHNSISQLWKRHLKGLVGGPQQRHRTSRAKAAGNQLSTNVNRTVLAPDLF
ncbi:hypothetical protein B0T21DRAFT_38983 [Apiosordaria backusii]|uniref:Uncharacterized protein n=1 Tax=Apiosordaria backusii TaxID=314023 RepID=A0AA40E1K0_9PEZI|nr:hypothetical protein B0T21DRAFT_38983 [Apiosordaria backusii]